MLKYSSKIFGYSNSPLKSPLRSITGLKKQFSPPKYHSHHILQIYQLIKYFKMYLIFCKSCNFVIDQATGGSVDWVKEQLKVPLVYCYELRDRGQFGFLLPADQIYPSGLETMDSVLEIIHQGKRFGIITVSDDGGNGDEGN